MISKRLSPEQLALKELILKKSFSEFGAIKDISIAIGDVYAPGHPICSPPVGWCAPGNYIGGSMTTCPNSSTTYTWCAS